MSKQNQFNTNE